MVSYIWTVVAHEPELVLIVGISGSAILGALIGFFIARIGRRAYFRRRLDEDARQLFDDLHRENAYLKKDLSAERVRIVSLMATIKGAVSQNAATSSILMSAANNGPLRISDREPAEILQIVKESREIRQSAGK